MFAKVQTASQAHTQISKIYQEADGASGRPVEAEGGNLQIAQGSGFLEITVKGSGFLDPDKRVLVRDSTLNGFSGPNLLGQKECLDIATDFVGRWNSATGGEVALDENFVRSQGMIERLKSIVADGRSPIPSSGTAWATLNELLSGEQSLTRAGERTPQRCGIAIHRSGLPEDETIFVTQRISSPRGATNDVILDEGVAAHPTKGVQYSSPSESYRGKPALDELNQLLAQWLKSS